jgi:hypothetical protein
MAALNEVAEERKRRNQETFRAANELIDDRRQELAIDAPSPYVCECWDPACRELVRLAPAEYSFARERENRYVVAPGHEHGETWIDGGVAWSIVEKEASQ